MKKNLFLFVIMSILITSCKKESVINSTSYPNNGTVSSLTAVQEVYVKAINPLPDSVIGGNAFNVTVVLNKPAPAGGFLAYVKTTRPTGPIIDVPSYVTIPEGKSTGIIKVQTLPVIGKSIQLFFVKPGPDINGLMYLISIVPRPESDPRPRIKLLEAENAVLNNVHTVNGQDASFSNGAFVSFDKNIGGSVKFDFKVRDAGNYYLVFSYATPSKFGLDTVTMNIAVNGKQHYVQFPFSASENSVQIVYLKPFLPEGVNNVVIRSIGKGSVRLDDLEVAAE